MFNWLDRLSVQLKLRAVVMVLAAGMLTAAVVGGWAQARMQAMKEEVVRQSSALSLMQTVDMAHDEMRSNVYAALLVGHVGGMTPDIVRKEAKDAAASIRETMTRMATIDLDNELRDTLLTARIPIDRYLDASEAVIAATLGDRPAREAALTTFDASFEEVRELLLGHTKALNQLNQQAIARADSVRIEANLVVGFASVLALASMLIVVHRIGQSIRNSLQKVQGVATAVAAGDLDRRADVEVDDEVGRLACSVNAMADKLQDMLGQALKDSERHSFTGRLADALEMADSEPAAYEVIQRGMAVVAPDRPMELLVADSSQAVLQRATEHPSAGAPGCGVDSPFSCQAVRRGNTVRFPDSEAINACPRLRGRPGNSGSVSAVCVPLHFMGRALGVLHSIGPINETQFSQLSALGDQAAARIGVVRAFERTQLQAATDSGTGLANRRALEAAIHELVRKRQPFALVMADLDRFKMLNDTYGHLVGDEALRLFADTMKKAVRDHDLVARWGGEEFAFILSGSTAQQSLDWAVRARAKLAKALEGSKVPKFTVSFGISDSTMAQRLEDLLRIADEALYKSKEEGRDRATLGTPVAANEPRVRQQSEHEAKIDTAKLNAG